MRSHKLDIIVDDIQGTIQSTQLSMSKWRNTQQYYSWNQTQQNRKLHS